MQIRMLVLAAVIAAATAHARAASANYFLTGNALYGWCTSGSEACVGYVMGVMDQLEATRASGNRQPCVRNGVSGDQAKDVVLKYLTDYPQFRDREASVLVVAAIATAFCP
jgi:Rap1a immunity proteins